MSSETQARLLATIQQKVQQRSWDMKRAVDKENLKDALKHASGMLHELRTGALHPRSYYELYIQVFDNLSFLEAFFHTVHRNGTPMPELYQMVQHAGNVLTRLYLLVTVGSVFIKTRRAPAKDILADLVEMVKGVQHPIRGLFLRYYLTQKTKDKLPDRHSEYEGHGGTIDHAIDFLLANFTEMNKLWSRMQQSGSAKSRKKRERQRMDLRVLVGSNIVRLSQLEGVDLAMYRERVLPRLLEQVTDCKDKIAQTYLMDCIIQAFPDEFHIHTLEPFLSTCGTVLPEVDVKSILVNLLTRITSYAKLKFEEDRVSPIPEGTEAFRRLYTHTASLVKERAGTISLGHVLELAAALMAFVAACYPDRIEYPNMVLGFAAGAIAERDESLEADADAAKQAVRLLSAPLQASGDAASPLQVLRLDNYPKLLGQLGFAHRRQVAGLLLDEVLKARCRLDSAELTRGLLFFLSPLVKDEAGTPTPERETPAEAALFEDEQVRVAKLVHHMAHASDVELFKILSVARDFFGHGGTRRIAHTLVPLVFQSLALARRVSAAEKAGAAAGLASRRVLQFVHETCTALALRHPELSLRLFLQCAQVAEQQPIAYEFFSQAFVLYEDLVDHKVQLRCINLMVATLHSCTQLAAAYERFVKRAALHAVQMLQQTDQCRMVSLCAHLFWNPAVKASADTAPGAAPAAPAASAAFIKPTEVLECLQRSLRIADDCMPVSCALFVRILNEYLFFFEKKCPSIAPKFIPGLIGLIKDHVRNMDKGPGRDAVALHFVNTMRHIQASSKAPDSVYAGQADILAAVTGALTA